MSARDSSASPADFPTSDSENYDAIQSNSPSCEDSPPPSRRPLILYQPPTVWSILRGAAINVFLPFVNGLMLGFGELFAREAAFRLGWGGTKIFPGHRSSREIGPGVEMRDDPIERRRREDGDLQDMMSME